MVGLDDIEKKKVGPSKAFLCSEEVYDQSVHTGQEKGYTWETKGVGFSMDRPSRDRPEVNSQGDRR